MNTTYEEAVDQIKTLTIRINELVDLLKSDKQNELNRRKLLICVARRRRLLDFLKKKYSSCNPTIKLS